MSLETTHITKFKKIIPNRIKITDRIDGNGESVERVTIILNCINKLYYLIQSEPRVFTQLNVVSLSTKNGLEIELDDLATAQKTLDGMTHSDEIWLKIFDLFRILEDGNIGVARNLFRMKFQEETELKEAISCVQKIIGQIKENLQFNVINSEESIRSLSLKKTQFEIADYISQDD
jgi:hypothetical protein